MPALPDGCPGWLSEVVLGLLRSDHSEDERRLTPAQAAGMLEVSGVAQQWEARQAAEQGMHDAIEEAQAERSRSAAKAAAREVETVRHRDLQIRAPFLPI
jgi:hypothetical protein